MKQKTTRPTVRRITLVRNLTIETKTCPQCGTIFDGAKVAKFCSRSCANKAAYDRNAATYRATRREKYAAERRVAGKRA